MRGKEGIRREETRKMKKKEKKWHKTRRNKRSWGGWNCSAGRRKGELMCDDVNYDTHTRAHTHTHTELQLSCTCSYISSASAFSYYLCSVLYQKTPPSFTVPMPACARVCCVCVRVCVLGLYKQTHSDTWIIFCHSGAFRMHYNTFWTFLKCVTGGLGYG